MRIFASRRKTTEQTRPNRSAVPSRPPARQGSRGQALDPSTREFMESRFDHDFSNVRIHSDDTASQSARGLHARAFTAGNDVAFASHAYSPRTYAGRRLLAHELAHVVQQSGCAPTPQIQRQDAGTGDAGPGDAGLAGHPPEETLPSPALGPAAPAASSATSPEITLETGNSGAGPINNLVHQQICVDGYGGSKRCFSFAASGLQAPQFSSTWLGWSSYVVSAVIKGEVYEPAPVAGATIASRHTPTAAQAARWLGYMTGTRLGLQDGYSVARHNCRTFSQWEFRDAPLHW
jgi:uncharacterized protein DUF4157